MKQILSVIVLLSIICLSSSLASKPQQKEKNQPKKLPKGFHTIPVFGSDDLKYYYTELYIGTPPQPTSVIIDTGSDFLAFPCTTCPKGQCGKHKYPAFNQKKSQTNRLVKCGQRIGPYKCTRCNSKGNCSFGRSYLEGSSLKGEVYTDRISIMPKAEMQTVANTKKMMRHLGGNKKKTTKVDHSGDKKGSMGVFGCTNRETGLFKTQLANGIMGLGPKSFGRTNAPNFVTSLYEAHKVNNRNFSVCLGAKGGYLTFGGYNVNKHIKGEPIQTVPYHGHYKINFYGPSAGAPLPKGSLKRQEAIVDSGTTYSYFLKPLFEHTQKQFKNWCMTTKAKKGKICGGNENFINNYMVKYDTSIYNNYDEFWANFPKLYLRLDNDFMYVWFPKDYMYRCSAEAKPGQTETWCSSIQQEGMRVNKHHTFGTLFMRHYDVYFNRHAKTMSFVRSECEDSAKRSYPVRSIRELFQKARILVGSLFSGSASSIVLLALMGLIVVAAMWRFMKFRMWRQEAKSDIAVGQPQGITA